MRRLPTWLADGPEVTDLAYRVAAHAFEMTSGTPIDNVEHLADVLDADEADVLRAMAELERVGVIVTRDQDRSG